MIGVEPMTRDEALAFARSLNDAANSRDTARMMEHYAADAVAVSPVFAEVRGRVAIARTFDTFFSMFPDCFIDASDVLVDGDRIAILATLTATDRHGWFGLAPTGGVIQY